MANGVAAGLAEAPVSPGDSLQSGGDLLQLAGDAIVVLLSRREQGESAALEGLAGAFGVGVDAERGWHVRLDCKRCAKPGRLVAALSPVLGRKKRAKLGGQRRICATYPGKTRRPCRWPWILSCSIISPSRTCSGFGGQPGM